MLAAELSDAAQTVITQGAPERGPIRCPPPRLAALGACGAPLDARRVAGGRDAVIRDKGVDARVLAEGDGPRGRLEPLNAERLREAQRREQGLAELALAA